MCLLIKTKEQRHIQEEKHAQIKTIEQRYKQEENTGTDKNN
jgi:hypothetical protein